MGVKAVAGCAQEMSAEYKDKEVIVSVAEVNPLHRKLMLSIINGQHNLQMRKIHVRSPSEAHRLKTTRVLLRPVHRTP